MTCGTSQKANSQTTRVVFHKWRADYDKVVHTISKFLCFAGEAAIAGPETSSITNLKTISFAADGAPQNGTNNGVGNGKLFVKIGGAESLQSTTTDGTGEGPSQAYY